MDGFKKVSVGTFMSLKKAQKLRIRRTKPASHDSVYVDADDVVCGRVIAGNGFLRTEYWLKK